MMESVWEEVWGHVERKEDSAVVDGKSLTAKYMHHPSKAYLYLLIDR